MEPIQDQEYEVAKRTILALLEAGYTVSVFDTVETTVEKSNDIVEILQAMRTTGEDYLIAYEGDENKGWVRFVYGNSGWDVINDYTTNLEDALNSVFAYAELRLAMSN